MSEQLAIAYEEIILKHDIHAFGYYWWGEKEIITQLRAQSNLAVSRLAALGRPGVTEGDVRTAMGMKTLDLLGGGGMFAEFFNAWCQQGPSHHVALGIGDQADAIEAFAGMAQTVMRS